MGWSSGECLKMPARRFFVMLKESRNQENKAKNLYLSDLCDIQAISICSGEYQEQVKNMFISRVTGGVWRRGTTVKVDYKDKNAANVLGEICKQKAKLEGLNG